MNIGQDMDKAVAAVRTGPKHDRRSPKKGKGSSSSSGGGGGGGGVGSGGGGGVGDGIGGGGKGKEDKRGRKALLLRAPEGHHELELPPQKRQRTESEEPSTVAAEARFQASHRAATCEDSPMAFHSSGSGSAAGAAGVLHNMGVAQTPRMTVATEALVGMAAAPVPASATAPRSAGSPGLAERTPSMIAAADGLVAVAASPKAAKGWRKSHTYGQSQGQGQGQEWAVAAAVTITSPATATDPMLAGIASSHQALSQSGWGGSPTLGSPGSLSNFSTSTSIDSASDQDQDERQDERSSVRPEAKTTPLSVAISGSTSVSTSAESSGSGSSSGSREGGGIARGAKTSKADTWSAQCANREMVFSPQEETSPQEAGATIVGGGSVGPSGRVSMIV